MIKITFDGKPVLDKNKSGIGWYSRNLIHQLLKSEEFECHMNYFTSGLSSEGKEEIKKLKAEGMKLHKIENKSSMLTNALLVFGYPYRKYFGEKTDVMQFFNYFVPRSVNGKKVTIIHDMVIYDHPETVRFRTMLYLKLGLRKSVKRADLIITDSYFSKERILKHLKVKEEKIRVIHPCIDYEVFNKKNAHKAKIVQQIRKKYSLKEKYMLYLGTLEPRKNIKRLILAYSHLVEKNAVTPELVIAGGKGWKYQDIYKTIKEKNLESRVKILGYVEEKDAPVIMGNAMFFVFPSMYEGFGMPPVEALACGTPVMAGNAASLPEALEKNAHYVDPFSVRSIYKGLKYMLENHESLRKELLEKDLTGFFEKYDSKKTVKSYEEIYREIKRNVKNK
ncbi:MAG: glycosyltransferase family 4 protein [Lachnospiraceae bacterium]|nr:glycosyltransferase family 4 protein [Lachnospiraceae bacterium]